MKRLESGFYAAVETGANQFLVGSGALAAADFADQSKITIVSGYLREDGDHIIGRYTDRDGKIRYCVPLLLSKGSNLRAATDMPTDFFRIPESLTGDEADDALKKACNRILVKSVPFRETQQSMWRMPQVVVVMDGKKKNARFAIAKVDIGTAVAMANAKAGTPITVVGTVRTKKTDGAETQYIEALAVFCPKCGAQETVIRKEENDDD